MKRLASRQHPKIIAKIGRVTAKYAAKVAEVSVNKPGFGAE